MLGKKEDESAMDFAYRDYKFKARQVSERSKKYLISFLSEVIGDSKIRGSTILCICSLTDNALSSTQALQLWTKAILAKSFRSWEAYKEESLRIRGQRLWMLYRAAKRRLRQWRKRTEFVLARRERLQIARAMGKLIVKRAKFLRWKTLVVTTLKLMRACNKFDKKFQRFGDGLGHLRYAYYRWKARLLLQRWDDETKYQVSTIKSRTCVIQRKTPMVVRQCRVLLY